MFDTLLLAVGGAPDITISWTERLTDPFLYQRTPLLVCTMIGAVLGLVGCFVVLRRMALLGDALSHAVLPGVVIAFLVIVALGGSMEGSMKIWGLSAGALFAGLFTSFGINLVARHSRVKEDTAIGIVFTAMFAVGVVLIGRLPRGTHFDLKCFLFGEPLAIQQEDLVTALVVCPIVTGLILLFYRPLKVISFDAQMAAAAGVPVQFIHYLLMFLLSAVVVTALQSVGVIMSVAMLVTPAAVAYQLTNRLSVMLILSASAGAISALVGMVLAFIFDMPPGPAMVIVATVLFGLTMAFAPEYGVIAKALRRWHIQRHILEEDVLKALIRLGGQADVAAVTDAIGRNVRPFEVARTVTALTQSGALQRMGEGLALTAPGTRQAEKLVRSHRIWETFLAGQDVPVEKVHEAAERLEHAHETAEEAADLLGHPRLDPHGEPIPAPPSNGN